MEDVEFEFETYPVITNECLKSYLEDAFDEDFSDLAELMWGCDFANNSYKRIYFRSDSDPTQPRVDTYYSWSSKEEIEEINKQNKVYAFLATNMPPQFDVILVDISW